MFAFVLVASGCSSCDDGDSSSNDGPEEKTHVTGTQALDCGAGYEHVWSTSYGPEGDGEFTPPGQATRTQVVVTDEYNDVYIAGGFEDQLEFETDTLTSAGKTDVFLAKFDASGTYLWSKRFGSTGSDEAMAISYDQTHGLVLAGHFEGTVDFGGGGLTSTGDRDVFTVVFDRSGNHE